MKVMLFGSFDLLHDGHRDLFRQAKAVADPHSELSVIDARSEVIVIVARDAAIRRLKHREPRALEDERLQAVAADTNVSRAILGHPTDFFHYIVEEMPDVLLLGYDQTTFSEDQILAALNERGLSVKIVRGRPFRPEKFKSSLLAASS